METIKKVYREAEGEMLTYKFRLYPTNEQEENLLFNIGEMQMAL